MKRVVATTCGAVVLSVVAATGAAAAPGPGTFTRITAPGSDLTFRLVPGGTNSFPVSGTTSPDVTTVDLDCITDTSENGVHVYSFAASVPVTGGAFHATASYGATSSGPSCRLRAVPTDVDPAAGYLGSYAGPVVRTDQHQTLVDANQVPYGFNAVVGVGDGGLVVEDVGRCGDSTLQTFPASTELLGHGIRTCLPALQAADLTTTGTPSGSPVLVDGHNVWLPGVVHSFLITTQGLPLRQPPLTAAMTVAPNGDVTLTESAALERCSGTDAYPPTASSCPSLAATGVSFRRVVTYRGAGHQATIRETFTSTDHHAHSVRLQYGVHVQAPQTGAAGFLFPRHGSSYTTGASGTTITGLGTGAGTVLIRSDLRSVEGDGAADTRGLTWSAPPGRIVFDGTEQDAFGMSYHLAVPPTGAAHLGFADSEGMATADVRTLANRAVAAMVRAPQVTSPAAGAVVHRHVVTVRGRVSLGANGLPMTVTVDGHRATLVQRTPSSATWSKRLRLSKGHHTIKVVATDSSGNHARSTISVRVRH